MTSAAVPNPEAVRLEILRQYQILDTPPEALLDDLTQLAALICETPIALISLIDETRQWFKSKVGLDACETSREDAFCAYAIQGHEIFWVHDACQDERFAHNPLVTAAPFIRFYAGVPLVTPEGARLGTLCVIDRVPRTLRADQHQALEQLSRQVMSQLELRRTLFQLGHNAYSCQIAMHNVQQARATLEQEVTQRTSELVTTNQLLQDQILERHRAEAALQQANDVLEVRVTTRTTALANTNIELTQEIARRQQIEAELIETTTLQQAILDSANYTIISTTADGIIRTFNQAAEACLGYTASEVVDQMTPEIFHDRHEVMQRAEELSHEWGTPIEAGFAVFVAKAQRGEVEEREWIYVRKDGSTFPVLLSITALRDASGRITGFLCIGSDITERQRTEQALRESEERWHLALRGNNDGIWDWNVQTDDVFFSTRWKEMLGYTDAEISNSFGEWESRVHPDDLSWVKQAVQDHFAYKTPFYITEHRMRCKDGSYKWILDRGQALWNEQGQVVRMVSSHTDITERKQFDEILRNTTKGVAAATGEAFFHSLVEYLTKALDIEFACIGELVEPTRDRVRLIACSNDLPLPIAKEYDLAGTPCANVIEQGVQVYTQDLCQRFPDQPLLQELGAESYIGAPLFGSHRQPLGLIAVMGRQPLYRTHLMSEILQIFAARAGAELERRQAEAELKRQTLQSQLLIDLGLKIRQSLQIEEILQTTVTEVQELFQADRVLVFQLNPDGSGQTVKEAIAPGWSSMLDLGVSDRCFGPSYLQRYRQGRIYSLTLSEDGVNDIEPCLVHFMRQFQIQSKLVMPILLKDNFWGLLIAHQCNRPRTWSNFEIDLMRQLSVQIGIALTQAQLLEQETQQRQELARSNADLEQFAYVASHDLQEPLRMVTSYLQLLVRRYQQQLGPDADEFIGYAVDGATRMQALINDLLSYSRVETRGKVFSPTDCNLVLERALANLRTTIAANQATIITEPLPPMTADATQMTQLLQNLISNAIKFRGEAAPKIQVGMTLMENYYRFFVRDNGIGIEPEYRDRIFLIFQRLHNRNDYPGTGIGLAICKRIVERHGGQIWVESAPDHGSIFYFTIPISEADVA